MDVIGTLETIKGAKDLAAALVTPLGADPNDREKQVLKQLIQALRGIYFTPQGTRGLLDQIAKGGYPNEEEIAKVLPEFNDVEDLVARRREDLHSSHVHRQANLTLRAENVLREISWGKAGVRQRVQKLLNESLTFGEPILPEQAQQLIDEIGLLNTAIEDAEEKLAGWLR